jgi:hypothetical protein
MEANVKYVICYEIDSMEHVLSSTGRFVIASPYILIFNNEDSAQTELIRIVLATGTTEGCQFYVRKATEDEIHGRC